MEVSSIKNLIPFDQEGVWGPAATLAINVIKYDKKIVEDLSKYIKEKFKELARAKAHGRKEFCAKILQKPLPLSDVLKTRFFQSMQKDSPPAFHPIAIEAVGGEILETVRQGFPQWKPSEEEQSFFKDWIAKLVETYTPEEILRVNCEIYERLGEEKAREVNAVRKKIGGQVYGLTQQGKFNEQDLDALLVWLMFDRREVSENVEEVDKLAAQYKGLFSLAEECADLLRNNIAALYDTAFRNKFFPKKPLVILPEVAKN